MENSLLIILLLAFAHLLGDFVLQSNQAIEAKRAGKASPFIVHGLIHAILAYVCVALWTVWLLPVLIGLTHGVIDWSKETAVRSARRKSGDPPRIARAGILAADQLLHLAVIVGAVILLVDPDAVPMWRVRFGELAPASVIALIGLVITTWCGAFAISFATEPYLEELKSAAHEERKSAAESAKPAGQQPDPAADADTGDSIRRGFAKGGRTIGLLERALVFLFVITGNMTGVGFLVAAKSVFRFGEISRPTQRKEAEYIIIGTLMSFTWAMFAAWLTRFALDALLFS